MDILYDIDGRNDMIEKRSHEQPDELKESIPEVRVMNFIWNGAEKIRNLLPRITTRDAVVQRGPVAGDKQAFGTNPGVIFEEQNSFEDPEIYEIEKQAGSLALLMVFMDSMVRKIWGKKAPNTDAKTAEHFSCESCESWDERRGRHKAVSCILLGLTLIGVVCAKGCRENQNDYGASRADKVQQKSPMTVQSQSQKTYGA